MPSTETLVVCPVESDQPQAALMWIDEMRSFIEWEVLHDD